MELAAGSQAEMWWIKASIRIPKVSASVKLRALEYWVQATHSQEVGILKVSQDKCIQVPNYNV